MYLLKWFDLLMDKGKEDHVRFHSLYKDEDGKIEIRSTNDYLDISPNPISEAFRNITVTHAKLSLGAKI
jgi:hypothetical protein